MEKKFKFLKMKKENFIKMMKMEIMLFQAKMKHKKQILKLKK